MLRSFVLSLALASPAGAFDLAFPADCRLGRSCYIQNYVDSDPGPGVQDPGCGPLSYDSHDGTDIALPTRAAMQEGVAVLAAAAGTVSGLRDGVADFAPVVLGQECGNGVVLDHGDGWETQYCHLKQGTVAVAVGQSLPAGAVLGQIGQSGQADFPHLHLTLRHDGATVDPFAPDPATACGVERSTLWAKPVPFQPGGLLRVGISTAVPDYDAIKAGLDSPDLPKTAPALVVWVYLFGTQPGDALLFTLRGPDGIVLTERSVLDKTQALAFRAVGKKRAVQAWPTGGYVAEVRMLRGTRELGHKGYMLTVTD